MELIDAYVATCEAFLAQTGISHPMAHLHVGLLIYVGVQIVLRTRRASSIALQAVYGAELVNEILQRAHYGSWRIEDTLGDIFLTVLWPTLLYGVAKFRRARWELTMLRRRDRAETLQSTHAQLASAMERVRAK